MDTLHIKAAAASPRLALANPALNAKRQAEAAAKAAAEGCNLIVFPELSLTGATCGDLFRSKRLASEAEKALRALAEATKELDAVIVTGLPCGGASAAAVLYKGNYEACGEGPSPEISPLHFMVNFGSSQASYEKNPEKLPVVLLGASQMRASDVRMQPLYILYLCEALDCPVIYANAGPGETTGGGVFGGECIIAECAHLGKFSMGRIIGYSAPLKREGGMAAAELGAKAPAVLEYKKAFRFGAKDPFIPEGDEDADEYCSAILEMQSCALAERLERAYSKKAIIGVSGGSDSTLAILAAARAMELLGRPASDVLAVTMPGFGTSTRTKKNAFAMMEALGCEVREISIVKSVNQHFEDIGHDPEIRDVTYENCQARERTQILMDLANEVNGLVVGTGDMSESALGWCTYNGDHMAMYSVNCGLTKGLVKRTIAAAAKALRDGTTPFAKDKDYTKLAEALEDVLDTPVSPELLPTDENGNIAQITEDKVGPYELHDFFLYHIVARSEDPSDILDQAAEAFDGSYDRETIAKWLRTFCRRFFSQQFKRSCSPEGPQITDVCLSPRGVWNMPSDADGSAWQML